MNIIEELKLKLIDARTLSESNTTDPYYSTYYGGQCSGIKIAMKLLGCTENEIEKVERKALKKESNDTLQNVNIFDDITSEEREERLRKRNDIKQIKEIIKDLGTSTNGAAQIEDILLKAKLNGIDKQRTEEIITKMRHCGDLMKPTHDSVKLV